MADEPEAVEGQSGRKKPRIPKTAMIVAAVTVVEAIIFFVVFKVAGGGPEPAYGERGETVIEGEEPAEPGTAEVTLLKGFKAPNFASGRMYIYELDVSVVVQAKNAELMETIAMERGGEIGDRVGQTIRSASDRMLTESDLRALRQQLLESLQRIVEDDELILRVLIPRYVRIRSD